MWRSKVFLNVLKCIYLCTYSQAKKQLSDMNNGLGIIKVKLTNDEEHLSK